MLASSSALLLLRRASQRVASSSSSTSSSFASASAVRGLQTQSLPDLPYDYSALEPVIPAEIMQLHHSKHHAAYVANLNASAEKYAAAESKGDVSAMLSLQPALKFNGGGHLNHSLLWKTLCSPHNYTHPEGQLAKAIEESFGSLENLQAEMTAAAVGVQGSGWSWLGLDPKTKKLAVRATANQDPLLATTGLAPLYGIDVWEHAYYLKYKNARPDYVKEIWKVTDWKGVARLFDEAQKK